MKLFHKRHSKLRFLAAILTCYLLGHFSGINDYLYQRNYYTEFSYPLEVNITKLMDQLRNKTKPDVPPPHSYRFGLRIGSRHKCSGTEKVHLLFLIKSFVYNYENREAIRQTWAREERSDGYVVRRVFLLALPELTHFQHLVEKEQQQYQDLVQGDFLDKYYNNTYKVTMAFEWVRKHCATARFILFADDDFYISTKNVLKLIRNPNSYPEEEVVAGSEENPTAMAVAADDDRLEQLSHRNWYTGFLFYVLPVRIRFHKFFVSLTEYPFNIFPPFINAGAFLISKETLDNFYYASLYTVPLKLDDVYVGILARKIGVEPVHNKYFFPYKVPCSAITFTNLIASHGYRDSQELIRVWRQQVLYGNA